MTIDKILALLAIVAATSPVYSKHLSLSDRTVFSDNNISWMSPDRVDKFADSSENEANRINYNVCTTKECKAVAKEFRSSMNKSVDPCDDFYEFACGAWRAKNVIPPTDISWSRMSILMNGLSHRVKEILEAKPDPFDIKPLKQAKQWYRSCMDTENVEERGVKSIASILMQVGGWPITMEEDEWEPKNYPWQIVERHYARLTGSPTLYSVKRYFRYDKNIQIVTAPDIPLINYFNLMNIDYSGKGYDRYVRIIEGVANLFTEQNRTGVSRERMIKEIEEIVDFEKEICKLKNIPTWELNHDGMTFDELLTQYDIIEANIDPETKIDWRSMMKELAEMANINVNNLTKILGYDYYYMNDIKELVMKTPTRTIVNYIHWNFVAKMLKFTTERTSQDIFQLHKEIYGRKEKPTRWRQCVNAVNMPHTAAYVFVNKYFTESTEHTTREMIKNIQIGLEHQIDKSNWLNQKSKEWVKEKLTNIQLFIGFPEWYKNGTAVVNKYKGLTMGTDFFDNSLNYMRYAAKKRLRDFVNGEPFDAWSFLDPLKLNAFYIPGHNILLAPASDFQPPFLTPEFPGNINYGTIGAIIGHEMGHAFDSNSIHYGKSFYGKLLPQTALMNYYRHAECFVEQFSRYFDSYFNIKAPESEETEISPTARRVSKKTQAENIADTIGLQSAFESYKNVRKNASRWEARLPGLEEFTEDQLFFLSYAAMGCEVDTPEYASRKLIQGTGGHSPGKIRVIGTVSNTKDFANAFHCPMGSPMNPRKKCNIWEMSEAERSEESRGDDGGIILDYDENDNEIT